MGLLRSGLGVCLLLYVALRAIVLVFAFDQVALVNYELYPMGTLPKALDVVEEFPLRLYYDNAAGQLVTGLAAWPFYQLFGDSYLVLKLVPATAGFGLVLVVWLLLDRHVSRRAANIAGVALALGPAELLTKYSLIASGNHFENLFFSALAILAAYRVHVVEEPARGRALFLAAAACGLAIFVFLGAIIPVGLLAAVHLGVRGWRGSLADLRIALPGFLTGVAPLILINLVGGGRGAAFLEAKFSGEGATMDWGVVVGRMADLLLSMPTAGFFRSFDGVSPGIPNLALVGCMTIAWLFALPGALAGVVVVVRAVLGLKREGEELSFARCLTVPFVLALPLTALAYGISNLRLGGHPVPIEIAGYRYFLPTFLFGVILVAMISDRAIGAGGWRRAAGWLIVGVTCGTGLWNLSYVGGQAGGTQLGTAYRGWNFMQAARGLFNHAVGLDDAARIELVHATPQPYRTHLLRGIGFLEAQRWVATESMARGSRDLALVENGSLPVEDLLGVYPVEYRDELARGMGTGLRTYVLTRSPARELEELLVRGLVRLVEAGSPHALRVVEGAGSQEDYPLAVRKVPVVLARSERLLQALPESLRPAYGRGLGEFCGRLYSRAIDGEDAVLRDCLHRSFSQAGTSLLEGIGYGLAIEPEHPSIPRPVGELTGWSPELNAQVMAGFTEGLSSQRPAEEVTAILEGLDERWTTVGPGR